MKKFSMLLIVLSGCFWGSIGIFVRQLSAQGFNAMDIVFIRSLFSALLFFSLLGLCNRKLLKFNPKDIWCFLGTGVLGIVFFNFCYYTTINVASMSIAATLIYTAPIFVMILSRIFFKEKITRIKVVAFCLLFSGGVLAGGILFDNAALTLQGFLIGITAGLGDAFFTFFSKMTISRGYNNLTVSTYTFGVAAIACAPFSNLSLFAETVSLQPSMLLVCLLFGIFSSLIPNTLYLMGLKHVEGGVASVLVSAELVAATFIGFVVYNEVPTLTVIMGVSCVICALVLLNLKPLIDNLYAAHKSQI